jgi:hypothetical protein
MTHFSGIENGMPSGSLGFASILTFLGENWIPKGKTRNLSSGVVNVRVLDLSTQKVNLNGLVSVEGKKLRWHKTRCHLWVAPKGNAGFC